MLRQLARLTAAVPSISDRAVAIAVYADAAGATFAADELGYEGVACVDDAARALTLFCDLSKATGMPLFRAWAEGLLDFVLAMQCPDGRFVNFIEDWTGTRNEGGITSAAGGYFWQARGLRGIAKAAVLLDDPRAHAGVLRGLPWLRNGTIPADVRAIHIRMAVELLRAGRLPELKDDLERWSDEVASYRRGSVLLNNPDEDDPHLWGHLQEGALADAGIQLARPDLIEVARRSALEYLAPLIASGFAEPLVQPYGVASAHYGVDRLRAATHEPMFAVLANQAREWFNGRNTAGTAVYDRQQGKVHDGIDQGRLNAESGAESNITGALTLFDEVATGAPSLLAELEGGFSPAVRSRLSRA